MGRSASAWLKRYEGFTLIELLVVVAIVGLLAALAVPRLFTAIDTAKQTPGEADLLVFAAALERHYVDNGLYPNGADSSAVMAALRGSYLKPTTSYRNGWNRGYLYLTSESGSGYVLIDMQKEAHDDDPGTGGQQIRIRCSDGFTDEDRTFSVISGDAATLTLPTVTAGSWRVSDSHIADCHPVTAGLNITVVTQ